METPKRWDTGKGWEGGQKLLPDLTLQSSYIVPPCPSVQDPDTEEGSAVSAAEEGSAATGAEEGSAASGAEEGSAASPAGETNVPDPAGETNVPDYTTEETEASGMFTSAPTEFTPWVRSIG